MEVFEKINVLIKEQGLNKKEFVKKLLLLEPKLKSTGEIPTEHAIYSYLNGNREIKIELIPYIAEALNITEQELFDDGEQARVKYLKHILKNPSKKEIDIITYQLKLNEIKEQDSNKDDEDITIDSEYLSRNLVEVIELLKYAPIPLLKDIVQKLQEIKKLSKI